MYSMGMSLMYLHVCTVWVYVQYGNESDVSTTCMYSRVSVQYGSESDVCIYMFLCTCMCARFLQSALISGEGLMSVGVAPEVAQEEVGKIHQENVERLSCLSEQEILEEQDRIRKLLGE